MGPTMKALEDDDQRNGHIISRPSDEPGEPSRDEQTYAKHIKKDIITHSITLANPTRHHAINSRARRT